MSRAVQRVPMSLARALTASAIVSSALAGSGAAMPAPADATAHLTTVTPLVAPLESASAPAVRPPGPTQARVAPASAHAARTTSRRPCGPACQHGSDRADATARLGVAVCVNVDTVVSLRLGVSLGGHRGCRSTKPDKPMLPPKPPNVTPKPKPTPKPAPKPTLKPTPKPAPQPRPRPLPPPIRQVPPRPETPERTAQPVVEHRPSPSVTPTHRLRVPHAARPPARRRNPLTSVLVLVVLTTLIASAAGVAFAAR